MDEKAHEYKSYMGDKIHIIREDFDEKGNDY
jgi:hypothetical protein